MCLPTYPPVKGEGVGCAVELVEVPIEQLISCRVGPWVAPLRDRAHRLVASCASLPVGVSAPADDLNEIVSALRHGVDTA